MHFRCMVERCIRCRSAGVGTNSSSLFETFAQLDELVWLEQIVARDSMAYRRHFPRLEGFPIQFDLRSRRPQHCVTSLLEAHVESLNQARLTSYSNNAPGKPLQQDD